MKEKRILSIDEVKAKYFFIEDFDDVRYCIDKNRQLLESIIGAYHKNDKKYLGNLLKTAKHYATYRFDHNIAQEYRLDKEWDEIINKIEQEMSY